MGGAKVAKNHPEAFITHTKVMHKFLIVYVL